MHHRLLLHQIAAFIKRKDQLTAKDPHFESVNRQPHPLMVAGNLTHVSLEGGIKGPYLRAMTGGSVEEIIPTATSFSDIGHVSRRDVFKDGCKGGCLRDTDVMDQRAHVAQVELKP